MSATPEAVLDALREVVDPEIGVNVVDLGLVYGVEVQDGVVRVRMTMTSPACPLGSYLAGEARERILAHVPGAVAVDVALVWEPPWDPGMMSDAARRQLGTG